MRALLGLTVLALVGFWNAPANRAPFPSHLRIHGSEWQVAVVDTMANGISGWTECYIHVILILRQEPASMAVSLAHEAEHAMVPCNDDGEPDNDLWKTGEQRDRDMPGEHPQIYFGARMWAEFIAENPEAVRFMEHARKDDARD